MRLLSQWYGAKEISIYYYYYYDYYYYYYYYYDDYYDYYYYYYYYYYHYYYNTQRTQTITAPALVCSRAEYLESHPPGRLVGRGQAVPPQDQESGQDPSSSSSSSSSSSHPGVIVTIVVGVLAIAAAVVGAAVYWQRSKAKPGNYHPAPGNDTDAAADGVHGEREVHIQMGELRDAVQVSSEDVGPQSASAAAAAGELPRDADSGGGQQGSQSGVRYGIPECDPLAPSSPAYQHVRHATDSDRAVRTLLPTDTHVMQQTVTVL